MVIGGVRGHAQCPVPTDGGGDCWNPPAPDGFADICADHMEQVSDKWNADLPEESLTCPFCARASVRRLRGPTVYFCGATECRRVIPADRFGDEVERERRETRHAGGVRSSRGPALPVVYYLKFGDRIKIGTTINLKQRLQSIPHDVCLGAEPGSYGLEAALHLQFRDQLVPGQREWFTIHPELVAHINQVRRTHGDPMDAFRRAQRGEG